MQCAVCGLHMAYGRRIYCSPRCYRQASLNKQRDKDGTQIGPRPCKFCGVIFDPDLSGAIAYCSVECQLDQRARTNNVFQKARRDRDRKLASGQ